MKIQELTSRLETEVDPSKTGIMQKALDQLHRVKEVEQGMGTYQENHPVLSKVTDLRLFCKERNRIEKLLEILSIL